MSVPSPSTSTIQNFTDALIANLKNKTLHPTLKNVFIVDGPPSVDVNQLGEWIMFGNAEGHQEWATINTSTKPKNEEYVLECWIDTVMATEVGQSSVNRRAFELLAEIEHELRDRPEQGLAPNLRWSQVQSPIRVVKNASDTWRECWIVVGIQVKARI